MILISGFALDAVARASLSSGRVLNGHEPPDPGNANDVVLVDEPLRSSAPTDWSRGRELMCSTSCEAHDESVIEPQ